MTRIFQTVDQQSPWIIGTAIVALIALATRSIPIQAVAILGVAAVAGFVAWLATGYRRPIRSRSVIAAYLAAIAFQIVHLAEEWNQDFPHEFTDLAGSSKDWQLDSFLAVFVFAAGALWVGAGAGALLGWRSANFFVWFYALGAGLINAIAHFILPVVKGGYFPGLITAPGHLLLSILLIRLLLVEDRLLRDSDSAPSAPASAQSSADTSPTVAAGNEPVAVGAGR